MSASVTAQPSPAWPSPARPIPSPARPSINWHSIKCLPLCLDDAFCPQGPLGSWHPGTASCSDVGLDHLPHTPHCAAGLLALQHCKYRVKVSSVHGKRNNHECSSSIERCKTRMSQPSAGCLTSVYIDAVNDVRKLHANLRLQRSIATPVCVAAGPNGGGVRSCASPLHRACRIVSTLCFLRFNTHVAA